MKIFVIGSHGFIGSNLIGYFVSKGHEVTGCDLVEDIAVGYAYQKVSILSPDFDTLFSSQQFDVCINASGSGNVPYSLVHPISDFEANTLCVAKALDTIRKYRPVCKYIHISSAAVYGNPKSLPIKETDSLSPLSPYGYHKLMSEQLCKEYYHLYNLPVAILRPFSAYGIGLKKQLLWDICTKLKSTDTINLYGTGNESRDFIHIDELVDLINIIIRKSRFECDIYNAATGKETTIKEITSIFKDHFKEKKKITFSGQVKQGDPVNWRADITEAKALGFKPKANIDALIVDYIKWYSAL